MRRRYGLPAFLFFSLLSAFANSQTVTFDSLTAGCSQIPGGTVEESGFMFNSSRLEACDATINQVSSNSSLVVLAIRGSLTVQRTDGAPFSLNSFDGTGLFANQSTNFSANAREIVVTGSLVGGGTVQSTFILDRIGDGPGPATDFETFFLPATFRNLESVTLEGVGANSNTFSVDDFAFSTVPTPCANCQIIEINSTDTVTAQFITGSLTEQLAEINSAPTINNSLQVNRHSDFHSAASFDCNNPPAPPLELPYVSTNIFLDDVDEITLDNCSSAWYRFTFELPTNFANATLSGFANVDDVAVLYLNGNRISASALESDPGEDRIQGGQRVLNWPSTDPFSCDDNECFRPGENELVFGVHGDLSDFDPTGLEFTASVVFKRTLILNGSFEAPSQIVPGRAPISTLTDWNSSGGFILLERGVNGVSGLPASDGSQFLSFGHNGRIGGTISQVFNTTVGQTYFVDFDIASIQGASPQTLQAMAFDDATNTLLGSVDSVTGLQNTWRSGSQLSFVASGNSTRLEFQHTQGANPANLALDNVLVTTVFESVTLGDANQDGVVNFLDIQPFISILSIGGFQAEADINEDGVVTFLDIAPFIALLVSS